MNYTKSQALTELRGAAKVLNLTFKASNVRLNGEALYQLVSRESGTVLISNYRLWTAYDDHLSGYWASWNGVSFEGVE